MAVICLCEREFVCACGRGGPLERRGDREEEGVGGTRRNHGPTRVCLCLFFFAAGVGFCARTRVCEHVCVRRDVNSVYGDGFVHAKGARNPPRTTTEPLTSQCEVFFAPQRRAMSEKDIRRTRSSTSAFTASPALARSSASSAPPPPCSSAFSSSSSSGSTPPCALDPNSLSSNANAASSARHSVISPAGDGGDGFGPADALSVVASAANAAPADDDDDDEVVEEEDDDGEGRDVEPTGRTTGTRRADVGRTRFVVVDEDDDEDEDEEDSGAK